jgi:hypothetical protein
MMFFMKNLTKILCASFVLVTFVACKGPSPTPSINYKSSLAVGYCSNTIESFLGTSSAGAKLSAAIQVPDTMLLNKGKEIVAIRVGVKVPAGTSIEVFISETLDGSSIYTQPFTAKGYDWEYIKLNTPYVIEEGKELYIGYNTTYPGYVIGYNVGSAADSKLSWVAVNNNWSILNTVVAKGCVSIQAFVAGGDYSNYPSHSLQMSNLQFEPYVQLGDNNIIKGIVTNYGVNQIEKGFKVNYTDGTVTQSVTVEQSLMNGESAEFALPSITPTVAQQINFTLTAVPIEGTNQGNNNTASGGQTYYGQSYERTILIEDFTGDRCVYCPWGTESIDASIVGNESRVAIVCHHVGYNEDNYTINGSKALTWLYNDGGNTYAPATSIDRRVVPTLSTTTPIFNPMHYATTAFITQQLAIPSFVTVNLNTTYNQATRELGITVSGDFLISYPNAKLNVFLVQNGIVGSQTAPVNTSGNYVSLADYNNGAQVTTGTITNYIHNHVVRAFITPESWGDDIPNSKGATYSKSYTYTIPAQILGVKNVGISAIPEDMYVVAFIADRIASTPANIDKSEVRNTAFKKIIE